MSADLLTDLVRLACLLILAVCAGLAIREGKDAHRRGMARVHRGQSWSSKPCCLDRRDGRRCDCSYADAA